MRTDVIAQYVVPWRYRVTAWVLGFVAQVVFMILVYEVASGAWAMISGLPVKPPYIGFMSAYSVAAQNGYWVFVISSVISVFVFSALFAAYFGAPPAIWSLGVYFLDEKGAAMTGAHAVQFALCDIALLFLLALPGPVFGFSLGLGSEALSLSLLGLGLAFFVYMLNRHDASGRTWKFRRVGLVPVFKSDADVFRQALADDV